MKRAFITGVSGFVGRHMSAELQVRGWAVDGCDTRRGSNGIVLPEDDALWHFVHNTTRYDLVVHCAAVEPHRAAIDARPMNLAANLHLDAAMFDWAARTKQHKVLYLSSSAAYPIYKQSHRYVEYMRTRAQGRLLEADINVGSPDAPDGHYGWTKLTGERIAGAANECGVATYVVRPFSGYGEDQGEDWPFGAFIARAVRQENPFVIWGSGEQVRDWIHISDVVNGALAVVDADDRRPVNLGTGVGTSMAKLARMVCGVADPYGKYKPWFKTLPDKPAGVDYRVAHVARMNEHYTAKVSIEEGIRRALA